MKPITIIIFILAILSACNSQTSTELNQSYTSSFEKQILALPTNRVEIIVFDDCEYIIYKGEMDANSAFGFMSHKGNCSNPIHQK